MVAAPDHQNSARALVQMDGRRTLGTDPIILPDVEQRKLRFNELRGRIHQEMQMAPILVRETIEALELRRLRLALAQRLAVGPFERRDIDEVFVLAAPQLSCKILGEI